MYYNLKNELDLKKFEARCSYLIKNQRPVNLTEPKADRTLSQNSLFHVWVAVLAEQLGESSIKDCKYYIKSELLGLRECINPINGRIEYIEYHTSEMDKEQMTAFMDKFKMWAMSEFGCYLPYYGDAGFNEMTNKYKK